MNKIFLIFFLLLSGQAWANSGWYSTLQGTASDVEQTPPPNGVTIAYNTTDHEWEFNYGLAPAGGTTGTCLEKNSNSNYDYSWITCSGGGGSQTPWTSNINGGGYSLSNVSAISATTLTAGSSSTSLDTITAQAGSTGGITINGNGSGNDSNTQLLIHNLTDVSQNTLTVTNNSVTSSSASPKFTGAPYAVFNGSANLNVPNESYFNPGSGSFTSKMYVNFSVLPTSGNAQVLMNKFDSGQNNGWLMSVSNVSGTYKLNGVINTGSSNVIDLVATITPTTSTWHFYTFVDNAGTYAIYYDGTQLATASSATAVGSNTNPVYIGANESGIITNELQGSATEIGYDNIARWTTNFTPPTTPFGSSSPQFSFYNGGSLLGYIEISSATNILTLVNNGITGFQLDSAGNPYFPVLSSNGIVTTSNGTGLLSITATTGTGNVVLANAPTFTGDLTGPAGGKINQESISCGGYNTLGTAVPTGTTPQTTSVESGTIISSSISGSRNGSPCSAAVDIWKNNAALPTVTNTITASDLPTLTSSNYAQDTTLTGWTTSVSANDNFVCNIQSTTCDRLNVTVGIRE